LALLKVASTQPIFGVIVKMGLLAVDATTTTFKLLLDPLTDKIVV
jgi:hypothetical protein